jgi:glutamate decarboxylase
MMMMVGEQQIPMERLEKHENRSPVSTSAPDTSSDSASSTPRGIAPLWTLVHDAVQAHGKAATEGVTMANVTIEDLKALFSRYQVPEGTEQHPEEYVAWLRDSVLRREMHLDAPKMAGHMTPTLPPFTPALAALVTAANCNTVKVETAKAVTFLERETVAMLHHEVYGRSEEFYAEHAQAQRSCLGIFASGGTLCNLQALVMARSRAFPTCLEDGCAGGVVVGSALMHYSIEKAAAVLGLGRRAVRKVPVEEDFRVNLELLAEECRACVAAGKKIVCVVGVAGATETGSVDDLAGLAAIATEFGCHFHVDAAWGGGLVFAGQLPALETADTVTLDAHKQLQCPMGAGVLLLRDPNDPARLDWSSEYIIRADSYDQGRFTVEGSRPAAAVYLHANLLCLGRRGLRAYVTQGLNLARKVAAVLTADPDFELVTDVQTNILLYRFTGGRADLPVALLDAAQAELQQEQALRGESFVSRTRVYVPRLGEKASCLRLVLGNASLTITEMKEVFEEQRLLGREALARLSLGA